MERLIITTILSGKEINIIITIIVMTFDVIIPLSISQLSNLHCV